MITPADAAHWLRNEFVAWAAKFSFAAFHFDCGLASRHFAVTAIALACWVSYGAANAGEHSQRVLLRDAYNHTLAVPTTFSQAVKNLPGGRPGVTIVVSNTVSLRAGNSYNVAVVALQRDHLQLSKAMLPTGPVISFGKALLEHENPLLILSAIAAVGVQAAIVIAMLIQDRRRRQAEQSLKESEERMAFAAVSTSTGFWQIEPTDWSLLTTDQCRTLFGFAADARLTLETLIERVHPEERAYFAQAMRTAVELRQPVEFDFRVLRPDGKIHWIAARGQPRDGDASRSASFIGIFTDITALKSAESDAELQRRQVTHLMRQSMLGELSGAIAHELNQPLTAILSNAETAQDLLNRKDMDLDQVRDILKDIIEDDNRAGEVIRRLRRLLRKGESKAEPINLNQLVESTLNLMRGELVRRRISVEVALAADMPASVGDSVQLQQVLLNLIMNAAEAMSEKPPRQRELIIITRATGEQIEAVIIDRGYGLAPEIEKQLFQPFFTTKEFGLGLGLSICSTIVKSHGGKLTVQNNAYGGATATVALPIQIAMAPS
jgi:PAS domain S-box-containing protein